MYDPESTDPVFVDPSGRRRHALRAIAIATAIVTGGYLMLVLLAVLGAPPPPGAELPLPPGVGPGAAANDAPVTTTVPSFGPLPTWSEPSASRPSSSSPEAATTSRPATTAPRTTETQKPRPSEPPGQGKSPTTPPGHG